MRPTASGKLVTVRAYRPEDAGGLFAAVTESVNELSPWETWCHAGYTMDEAAEYVNWCARLTVG